MKLVAFCGPTISAEEAQDKLGGDALVLPPAAQGDVYRAARLGPAAIGIVDGYFERVPAVWHKEILWAMAHGVHVLGAASMGALRAAELAPFGMEGVGWIFDAYRQGRLTNDDEVAVAHGPPETGYRAQSEALVNIRRTADAAVASGVVSESDGAVIVEAAAALFYPLRLWPTVLDRAMANGLPAGAAEALRVFLPSGRVDQKRVDALCLLDSLAACRTSAPKQVGWQFENTVWWDHLAHHAGTSGEGAALALDDALDELRLDQSEFAGAYLGALLRHLTLEEAQRAGVRADPEAVRQRANQFCWDHGLDNQAAFEAWLRENDLSLAEFNDLMRDEELIHVIATRSSRAIVAQLPRYLRASDRYAPLHHRARHKQELLETHGVDNPGLADAGFASAGELYAWWFGALGRPVPEDPAAHARDTGFLDEPTFQRVILREYCYGAREGR